MKKLLLFMVVMFFVGSLVCFAAGQGEAGDYKEKPTIAFIVKTLNNEYYVIETEGAKEAAERLGVELIIQAGERHGSVDEQLQIIERMIAREVDAIILVAASTTGMINPIEKALDAGIPVILADNGIDADAWKETGRDVIPFVGSKHYDGGKLVADYMLDVLNLQDAKVAILNGIDGQSAAIDRKAGFHDRADGHVNIVAEQSAGWEVEKAYTIFQNMLQAHPDIEFLFAANDNMAIGASMAAIEDGSDVKIVGIDAVPAALDKILEGDLHASVAQYPARIGATAVQMALDLLNGKSVEKLVVSPQEVITKDKAEEFKGYVAKYLK